MVVPEKGGRAQSSLIMQEVGIPITTLLAGAGIVGIAVGFGGQYHVRDIISGFFLILENQDRGITRKLF